MIVKNMETKGFFQFEIIINVLVSYFLIHLNIYVYGSNVTTIIYIFTLTARGSTFKLVVSIWNASTDVRFCRLKSIPAL